MSKILIVEDDNEIAMLENDYLEMEGMTVTITSQGDSAFSVFREGQYDLVILDLMLPGKGGFAICKEIREVSDVPILMVTARQESIDKIRGLGIGADDYITKPFDPAELVARVKAHLARYERLTGGSADKAEGADEITVGHLIIFPNAWKVLKNGEEIKLPNREFELLRFLAQNPNVVFTKEQLFERIWGYDYVGDSATVTVHINRLREKLEADPSKPVIIETVWGAGYRLNK